MDLDGFWSLVGQARAADGDSAEHAAELERLLTQLAPSEIEEFARIQGELMRASYRWDLWGAAYIINRGCSDDCFDYFRGWLLMRGREVWDAAMRDPETLADVQAAGDAQCEDALYVASKAFEASTGATLSGEPLPPPETSGRQWDEGDLPALYPRLWKHFGPTGVHTDEREDVWDGEMSMAFSLLAKGDYAAAATIFAAIRKGAPRHRTRALAANNLAWTNLMIDTPEATDAAQALATEARREIEAGSDGGQMVDATNGTLAFALIKQGEFADGLALIDEVLLRTPPESGLYATRLCIKAIGLARSGDLKNARALVNQARQREPSCQLLGQASAAVSRPAIPVPVTLAALTPLVHQFGISDDAERGHAIEKAPTEQLLVLMRNVTADVFADINRYLDETDNADYAVPFGDLAQAAMEARLELGRRGA